MPGYWSILKYERRCVWTMQIYDETFSFLKYFWKWINFIAAFWKTIYLILYLSWFSTNFILFKISDVIKKLNRWWQIWLASGRVLQPWNQLCCDHHLELCPSYCHHLCRWKRIRSQRRTNRHLYHYWRKCSKHCLRQLVCRLKRKIRRQRRTRIHNSSRRTRIHHRN